jgi:hypothetical protein
VVAASADQADVSSITRAAHVLMRFLREEFLYELKAGPAGGRLRRPSSRRQRHDGNRGIHSRYTSDGVAAGTVDMTLPERLQRLNREAELFAFEPGCEEYR